MYFDFSFISFLLNATLVMLMAGLVALVASEVRQEIKNRQVFRAKNLTK